MLRKYKARKEKKQCRMGVKVIVLKRVVWVVSLKRSHEGTDLEEVKERDRDIWRKHSHQREQQVQRPWGGVCLGYSRKSKGPV